MKVDSFLNELQNYYGWWDRSRKDPIPYPQGQRVHIMTYLVQFNDMALNILLEETLYHFSCSFKCLPDIAVFEGLRKDVMRRMQDIEYTEEAKERKDMIEDTSENLPREQVAEIIGDFAEKMGGKIGRDGHG